MTEVVDRDEAIGRALALLKQAFGDDLRAPRAGEIVIREQLVAEHDNAWAVPFNSRRFLEAQDPGSAMLPSLIVVPKDDHPAHYAPTAMPVAEYLSSVATGTRRWSRPPPSTPGS
ncbi:YrhB domain-containing protein [Saccharothrix deserti]|uniref:YrhB domain-containing protein n=1 Tax=Saccharothrix deserti TaxID=2593674 RepID=UPI00131A9B35|nr:YrhB domain-containing protein [Saccharothrix deserti]